MPVRWPQRKWRRTSTVYGRTICTCSVDIEDPVVCQEKDDDWEETAQQRYGRIQARDRDGKFVHQHHDEEAAE